MRYLPAHVKLVEQGHIVADSLKDYLLRHPEMKERLSAEGNRHYLTTEKTELFERMAGLFMGEELRAEQIEI